MALMGSWKQQSFSIVELLIILVLLSILVGLIVNLVGFSPQLLLLRREAEKIRKTLEVAREKSLLQEGSLPWGVYFENTTTENVYYLFSGAGFSSAQIKEKILLPATVVFTQPTSNSSTEVIFSRFNGKTTSTMIELSSKSGKNKAKLDINNVGQVTITFE
jgi:Tfp pilus assembly protein FimT